jgi:hypothetical protein
MGLSIGENSASSQWSHRPAATVPSFVPTGKPDELRRITKGSELSASQIITYRNSPQFAALRVTY